MSVIKSELKELLEKNTEVGLNRVERSRARQLIAEPVYSKNDCWLCKMVCPKDIKKAIFDTRLCIGHAYYALDTRK